jgi:hypothetical protein
MLPHVFYHALTNSLLYARTLQRPLKISQLKENGHRDRLISMRHVRQPVNLRKKVCDAEGL